MTFVSLPFRYPIKNPNSFQCSGPGWLIFTTDYLSVLATSGPTFSVYHIICPTNSLYFSMSVGYFSLLLLRFVPVESGVFWTLASLPVNFSYPPTNLLEYFSMVIFVYMPLNSWHHLYYTSIDLFAFTDSWMLNFKLIINLIIFNVSRLPTIGTSYTWMYITISNLSSPSFFYKMQEYFWINIMLHSLLNIYQKVSTIREHHPHSRTLTFSIGCNMLK